MEPNLDRIVARTLLDLILYGDVPPFDPTTVYSVAVVFAQLLLERVHGRAPQWLNIAGLAGSQDLNDFLDRVQAIADGPS